MPYKSDAQRKYFNSNKDKLGAKVVNEFNKASKGMKLPDHVKKSVNSYAKNYIKKGNKNA